jgi:transposase
MGNYHKKVMEGEPIFIGVDMHKRMWHVTVLQVEEALFSGSIPGNWESFSALLSKYGGNPIFVAYEAGCFGFWLCDRVKDFGADCIVAPPSLIPTESGNRVKTDRRDSRKLAFLLSSGMLKRVWVPDAEARTHRAVARRRRQLIQDRVRVQQRIKSELTFYGMEVPFPVSRWHGKFVNTLREIRFSNDWAQESFGCLIDELEFLSSLIDKQTLLLKKLSQTERYKKNYELLCTIPGFGLITSMEVLVELGDVSRFGRGDRLAAYVGLTPSQHSSGDKVRMGRITGAGRGSLRGTLVEAAWRLIFSSGHTRRKYEDIKKRAGGKRAIVAIARNLVLRVRRMLIDGVEYREEADNVMPQAVSA